jgi:hypothetical protein
MEHERVLLGHSDMLFADAACAVMQAPSGGAVYLRHVVASCRVLRARTTKVPPSRTAAIRYRKNKKDSK